MSWFDYNKCIELAGERQENFLIAGGNASLTGWQWLASRAAGMTARHFLPRTES
jgi:hypothetical protein